MTQTEIAYQNILTVVALWQSEQKDMDLEKLAMLKTSMTILGESAGLSDERMSELAAEIRDSAKQMFKADEN